MPSPLPENCQLFIFCALQCEAKPVIDYFGLKKIPEYSVFEIYKQRNYCLTITGVGKSNMAAGVAYTLASIAEQHPVILINIGVAGHMSAKLGRLFMVEKIHDADSAKNHYPQMLPHSLFASQALETVSQPQENYAVDQLLYDMEASAFYEVATRFTYSELVTTLKIVSDNAQSSINAINAKRVTEWIGAQLDTISQVIESLIKRAGQLNHAEVDHFEKCINVHHFTVSEKVQLKALLSRWDVLSGKSALSLSPLEYKSTRAFLDDLNARINTLPVML